MVVSLEPPLLEKELASSLWAAVASNDLYCENSEYEVQLTLIKSPVPMGLPDLYTDILEYPGAGVALGHYRR